MFDFGLQLGPRKPEKQHASVGKALIEDQLAEIPVGNNQCSLLLAGDRKDILVGKMSGLCASSSSTRLTAMRVPRTTGFPPNTFGSAVMRSTY
jgi:hypothetical protein